MNLPEEVEILDKQYWLDKISGKFSIPTLEKKKAKKNLSFKQMLKNQKRENVFEFAPEVISTDVELVLFALDKRKVSFYDLNEILLSNKEFVLKYVEQSTYPVFYPLPLNLKEDKEVFIAYYKKTPTCFRDMLWQSKKFYNRETIKELLQINGSIIEELSNTYKDDLELAKIVIDQNPYNIKFLNKRTTDKICIDKDYCKKLLEKNFDAFEYISLKLRGDKEFVYPYVNKDRSLIKKLNKKLKNDKDFVEKFVNSSVFIHSVGDELKKDEDIMLKAAKHNPSVIYYVDSSLKNDNFYIKAVAVNPNCYQWIWGETKKNPDIIVSLLSHEFYYNEKYEKADPIDIIDKDILNECKIEYEQLPNQSSLNFHSFVRNKYLKNSLIYGLNEKNDEDYKSKKLKI